MWSTIISGIIPLIMKVVEYFIDKKVSNDQAKKKFLEMINEISKDKTNVSIKLSASAQEQLNELKKKS